MIPGGPYIAAALLFGSGGIGLGIWLRICYERRRYWRIFLKYAPKGTFIAIDRRPENEP